MPVNIEDELVQLNKVPVVGRYLTQAFRKVMSGVNNLGTNLAVDPTGDNVPEPPPVQSMSVKASGGFYHATINDASPIQRGLNYFVEYDSDPAFKQPHVVHLGASRTMSPIQLPAKDDDGNDTAWHFRSYSQYRGGKPGSAMNFGGKTPTPVSGGGTLQMTLLPSTGSGTAQNSGQQGASGLGRVQQRPQPK